MLTREIPALSHTDADNDNQSATSAARPSAAAPGGVDPAISPVPLNPAKPGTATGDTSGFTLWLALLSVSALASSPSLRGKKRRA